MNKFLPKGISVGSGKRGSIQLGGDRKQAEEAGTFNEEPTSKPQRPRSVAMHVTPLAKVPSQEEAPKTTDLTTREVASPQPVEGLKDKSEQEREEKKQLQFLKYNLRAIDCQKIDRTTFYDFRETNLTSINAGYVLDCVILPSFIEKIEWERFVIKGNDSEGGVYNSQNIFDLNSYSRLSKVTLGKIEGNGTIRFPVDISSLTVEESDGEVVLDLTLCRNLEELKVSIHKMPKATLVLSHQYHGKFAFNFMKTGNVQWEGEGTPLPPLDVVEFDEGNDIKKNMVYDLSGHQNLKKFTCIKNIGMGAVVKAPPGLEKFTGGNLGHGACLDFRDCKEERIEITLGNVWGTFFPPKSLESVHFGDLDAGKKADFSECAKDPLLIVFKDLCGELILPENSRLQFFKCEGEIGKVAKINFSMCPQLKTVEVKKLKGQMIVPPSINQFISEEMGPGYPLDLANCSNLQSFKANKVERTVRLPQTIKGRLIMEVPEESKKFIEWV